MTDIPYHCCCTVVTGGNLHIDFLSFHAAGDIFQPPVICVMCVVMSYKKKTTAASATHVKKTWKGAMGSTRRE